MSRVKVRLTTASLSLLTTTAFLLVVAAIVAAIVRHGGGVSWRSCVAVYGSMSRSEWEDVRTLEVVLEVLDGERESCEDVLGIFCRKFSPSNVDARGPVVKATLSNEVAPSHCLCCFPLLQHSDIH